MERLFSALRSAPSISAWKVNILKTESCELFYVQKKVETVRATDTVDYSVTIYVDKDGKRGQSSFAVYPYMSEKEILDLIEKNVFAASFTLNTYFDLPHPVEAKEIKIESNLADKPFVETIGEIGAAIMKANDVENASLSATEVFLYKKTKHILNSNGIDVASTSYECKIETIPNFVKGKEEVELYKAISFASFNPDDLTAKVAETIALCRDRAHAVQMPQVGVIPVIIQDEEVEEFFESFASVLDYRTVYSRADIFKIGDDIQKDRSGDELNIKLKPFVEGALSSSAVDGDGVTLSPRKIIEHGKAVSLHGSYRYGYYIGEKNPTGVLPVLVASPGTHDIEELKKKPHVRCVRFSGIQIDPYSDFIGGEVRLGYYFDGEKEIPVTGFSIQADYRSTASSFLASKQTIVLDSYQGPRFLFLPEAKIA